MMKKIFFDLDGTVANLYGQENWLTDLRLEKKNLFKNLKPLCDMKKLNRLAMELKKQDWEIDVITWLPMNVSPIYESIVKKEKQKWIKKYMPFVTETYMLSYGELKQNANYKKCDDIEILIDDNDDIRNDWNDYNENRISLDAIDVIKNLTIIKGLY